MKVTRLKLTNVRAIAEAEFHFQPGFNLIVGVNGVGKTSVLNTLSVCLSKITVKVNQLRLIPDFFSPTDIRVGTGALSVECEVLIGKSQHCFLIHKPRTGSVRRATGDGLPREQVHQTPDLTRYIGDPPQDATGKERQGRPFVILFSTTRAVPSDKQPTKRRSSGGIAAAYAEAWNSRELRIAEFADWMRVQQTLKDENPSAKRMLTAFERAVKRFLDGYSKLRVEETDTGPELVINRGKTTIPVRQLSDGERGTLALVLDLTRRLAQANPEMTDPAKKAEAVVLIDEIDLHLHPKWQRRIVGDLTTVFPKCQFIATTHSPQVIGEVAHERIQIMTDGQVHSPSYSFGVDSSRVLEEIMDSRPRSKAVDELLDELSRTMSDRKYTKARKQIAQLVEQLGENDPEVTRARTLLEFMEGDQ